PERWKQYVNAWKRIGGIINNISENWPWSLENINLTGTKGTEYKISKADWMKTRWINNKRKDTFWRFQHRALPLGYRLTYIIKDDNGKCPNCLREIQTLEHFGVECKISKEIWRI
ncbi:722_t:CDS:2, partial [Scutellospora calospora]